MARMRTSAIVAAIRALASVIAPVARAQQSFGADLNRPPNATFTCERYPVLVPFFGVSSLAMADPRSCTWTSAGTFGDLRETANVPGDGIVTQVRVRTGPSVGPMQVVILRSLSDAPTQETLPAPSQCCQIPVASQIFVPVPNAITTVPVNLPVTASRNARGIGTFDAIGLSILAPNVAVPAHDTVAQDGGPLSTGFSPAVAVGTQTVERNGAKGVQLLLNADWVPAGVPPVNVVPPPVAVAVPVPVRLGNPVARVSSGNALVDLICGAGPSVCEGALRLLQRGAGAATVRPALGTATYKLRAGKRAKVKVKLTKAGRALVRRRGAVKVRMVVTPKGGKATTRTLTLRGRAG